MIILNRKRLGIMLSVVLIAVFVFTFQTANINKTVQTVSLPVSNKVIVLDAGHGKPDEGAQSTNRNNGSRNKFKNHFKSAKFIRAEWGNSNINTF